MKVQPHLFSSLPPPVRASGEISEARLAFEAMLRASSAHRRTTEVAASQTMTSGSARIPAGLNGDPKPNAADQSTLLQRPGRVLDIKV